VHFGWLACGPQKTEARRTRCPSGFSGREEGVHLMLANPPWRQLRERAEKIPGDKKHVEEFSHRANAWRSSIQHRNALAAGANSTKKWQCGCRFLIDGGRIHAWPFFEAANRFEVMKRSTARPLTVSVVCKTTLPSEVEGAKIHC